MIEDLLIVPDIERAKIRVTLEPVWISDTVENAVMLVKNDAGKEIINNISEDFPLVLSDKDRLEQVIVNLIENAIKYSPNNKAVEVIFEEKGHLLDVTIKSIGPYCDENEILHLCDKGFRSENARIAQSTGQGFGLNFAKKICLAHNIGITFDSVYLNKDHGVKYGTFSVRLHFDNGAENTN